MGVPHLNKMLWLSVVVVVCESSHGVIPHLICRCNEHCISQTCSWYFQPKPSNQTHEDDLLWNTDTFIVLVSIVLLDMWRIQLYGEFSVLSVWCNCIILLGTKVTFTKPFHNIFSLFKLTHFIYFIYPLYHVSSYGWDIRN